MKRRKPSYAWLTANDASPESQSDKVELGCASGHWPKRLLPGFGRERFRERVAALDPEAEIRVFSDPWRADEDIAGERLAGEVHFSDVLAGEGVRMVFLADPGHDLVASDPDKHVSVLQERQAAEHALLGHANRSSELGSNTGGKCLVVCHGVSVQPTDGAQR